MMPISSREAILYFGVLGDGTEVVVKRIDLSSLDKELCLVSEIKALGTMQHSRVLPLLGHCLDRANEKFLVYKYMPNKDLSRFLNGDVNGDRRSASLDWTTRLKIAMGVLEGLCYLHHHVPSLIHRDIQASSIPLDDKFEVQLGSLIDVCVAERGTSKIKIPSFLQLKKGFGQSNTPGKLISPINDSSQKDWLANILRQIVPNNKKLVVNIVDQSLRVNQDHLVHIWSAFVAKTCLNRNPSKRPQAEEILLVLCDLVELTGRPQFTGHHSLPASTLYIQDEISGGSPASHLKFDSMRIRRLLEDYTRMKVQQYSYSDIKKITNCFRFKLGRGGFGTVFKGKLPNEVFVAVRLFNISTMNRKRVLNEVATMGMINHENVVHLLGFCVDGIRIALVYEFLPHGSLDKFIFQDSQDYNALGVEKLQHIAIGIARGIDHLHQGCAQMILHLDIKPQNILLDENYNPKISDFGLAKLCGEKTSLVSVNAPRGTMGYIAPEMFSSRFGDVSCKSDIYSFGISLLEMVGRRRNLDINLRGTSKMYFPEWVYRRLMSGGELRIQADEEDGENQILKKLAIVGLCCIQWSPMDRPSTTAAVQMLEGSIENLKLPPNDFPLTLFPHPMLSRNNISLI